MSAWYVVCSSSLLPLCIHIGLSIHIIIIIQDIQCDIPLCTGGLVVTYDDLSCCPYCSPPTECRDDQYRCTDGLCVPSDWECDTVRDCALGEDEHAGCVYGT